MQSKLTLQYLHCINYVLMVLLLTSPSVHSLSFAGYNHPCFHCSVLLCSLSSKLLEALEEITAAQPRYHGSNRIILAHPFGEISLYLLSQTSHFPFSLLQ